MSQINRIERILEAILNRTADEVGSLLGAEFVLTPGENKLFNKQDSFAQFQGKQVCAKLDIRGDIEGQGCLLIGIKDAIRLGGTLIMLPESELEEVISREEYTDEIEDSYGEIANIISGSFTKDFEEMYPKACRFIRKEQSVVAPAKVETESDEPVADQTYFNVIFGMTLDGQAMGQLVMLMPASTFELEVEAEEDAPTVQPQTEKEQVEQPQPQTSAENESTETVDTQPHPEQAPKFDYQKHKDRFNKILGQCQERLEEEVGGLLGVSVTFTDIENRIVNKEDFFLDHVMGEQVIADMEVVGELEGKSYLAITKNDAIHLGGVLIMLPPSELEIAVAESDFGDDAKDAYGEIANIASGVYTSIFEESYTKKVRFIRKEFEEVAPGKVEVESDEPIEDKEFYVSTLSLAVDGAPLGKVHMLFPADLFQLLPPERSKEEVVAATEETQAPPAPKPADAETAEQVVPTSSTPPEGTSFDLPDIDLEKHRARVDTLLTTCQQKMEEEMSSLIGVDVKLMNLTNTVVSKEDFFTEKVAVKQVLANMDVVGDVEGKSYLSVDIKDAIRFGGVLIMLPSSELDGAVNDENFGDDARDAYGEIANIIAGVYSGVFEEQYTEKIRFIKTDLLEVFPMKVDIESDDPIPDTHYYHSSMDLELDGNRYGKLNLLVPLGTFQLQGLVPAAGQAVDVGAEQVAAPQQATPQVVQPVPPSVEDSSSAGQTGVDVLLVGDDEVELTKISTTLQDLGFSVKSLSFKDNVHNYLPGKIRAVYLVMKDVNEHVFGTAIKISSTCSLPIVAAGPGWTRSKVIKAVKYGVADILLTPASHADIKENVDNNLTKMAA